MYFCGGWEHASGDEVIYLNGGLSHHISQWFDILIKVLKLLTDHCAKYALDLTLLCNENLNNV